MTSNIGLQSFNQAQSIGFEVTASKDRQHLDQRYEQLKAGVLADLQKRFRPEFLNRLDKIIVYRPLTIESVEEIVDLQITEVDQRLRQQGIKVSLSPKARRLIAEMGFSPEYGARAVRRVIQEHVENQVAGLLLSNQLKSGQTVRIGVHQNKLTVERLEKKSS